MKKSSLVFVLGALLSAAPLCAQSTGIMPPVEVRDTQMLGLGGPHAAWTDTAYSFFVNPAAIQRTNRGSAFELGLSVPKPFELLEFLPQVSFSDFSSFTKLFTDKKTGAMKFGPGVTIQFPLAISWISTGIGFGVWDQIGIDTKVLGDYFEVGFRADFIAAFGMSTSIVDLLGHSVDVGLSLKPFVRAFSDGVKGVKVTDFLADKYTVDDLFKDAGIPVVAGLGLDAGIMYRFRQWASFGISFNDIITRGFKVSDIGSSMGAGGTKHDIYYVPFSMNVGASGSVRLRDFFPSLPAIVGESYLALMIDWRDILNQHWGSSRNDLMLEDTFGNRITVRNPILNISAGAELGLFRYVRLRFGMNEMLPAFGFGLHFGAFQISTSIYGVELGNEPGQFSTYAGNISISVRPESKKRDKPWPWSGPIVNRALGLR